MQQGDPQVMPDRMQGWANGVGNGFRYALAVAFDRLIMMPFGAYFFGIHVRFFLALQELVMKYTGLKYWITVLIFLPPFLVLECVCCLRAQIVNMIRGVTSTGCIQGPELMVRTRSTLTGERVYSVNFSSVRGIFMLWDALNAQKRIEDPDSDSGPDFATFLIYPHGWVDILCWIFLVGDTKI